MSSTREKINLNSEEERDKSDDDVSTTDEDTCSSSSPIKKRKKSRNDNGESMNEESKVVKTLFIDTSGRHDRNRLPYPERVSVLQHEFIELQDQLKKLERMLETHIITCEERHHNSYHVLHTSIETFISKQVKRLETYTIDKVVKLTQQVRGAEERIKVCWEDTQSSIQKIADKEKDRSVALDHLIHNQNKKNCR